MSFELIEEIKKKVPERFHAEPDFKALIDTVRLNEIHSKIDLLAYFEREIKDIEIWITGNIKTGGTIVKDLRDKMIRLGSLKSGQKYIEEYCLG